MTQKESIEQLKKDIELLQKELIELKEMLKGLMSSHTTIKGDDINNLLNDMFKNYKKKY